MHLFALMVALVPITVQLVDTKGEPVSEPAQGAGELRPQRTQMREFILRLDYKKLCHMHTIKYNH